MDALLLTYAALALLALIRNEIAWGVQRRRIEEIHAANLRDIAARQYDMPDRYATLRNQYLMVLDLSKWTYSQFYPEAA